MDLKYPTLRIDQKTVDKFNVQAFPSLLLIDASGIIRSFDEGYTLTLRSELDAKIQALLDSNERVSRAGIQ